MPRYPSRTVRLWRWRPWNGNPLMRTSDRWEALVRLFAAMAVLIAVPLAVVVGTDGSTKAAERIRVENSAKVAVTATVVRAPEPVLTVAGQDDARARFQAPVRWSREGREGSATVPVPGAAEPGSHVTVWFDSAGKTTAPPRPYSDALWAGVALGAVIFVGICFGAMVLALSTGRLLDRIRGARLAAEWRRLSGPIGTDME
ncbi:Rv1733c family protein [Nocardia sp. NPDC004750]